MRSRFSNRILALPADILAGVTDRSFQGQKALERCEVPSVRQFGELSFDLVGIFGVTSDPCWNFRRRSWLAQIFDGEGERVVI